MMHNLKLNACCPDSEPLGIIVVSSLVPNTYVDLRLCYQ